MNISFDDFEGDTGQSLDLIMRQKKHKQTQAKKSQNPPPPQPPQQQLSTPTNPDSTKSRNDAIEQYSSEDESIPSPSNEQPPTPPDNDDDEQQHYEDAYAYADSAYSLEPLASQAVYTTTSYHPPQTPTQAPPNQFDLAKSMPPTKQQSSQPQPQPQQQQQPQLSPVTPIPPHVPPPKLTTKPPQTPQLPPPKLTQPQPHNSQQNEFTFPGVSQIIIDDGHSIIKKDAKLPQSQSVKQATLSTYDRVRAQTHQPRYPHALSDPIAPPSRGYTEVSASQPSRSIDPFPSPDSIKSRPMVNSDDFTFKVGQPFPVVATRVVYYYPITISVTYLHTEEDYHNYIGGSDAGSAASYKTSEMEILDATRSLHLTRNNKQGLASLGEYKKLEWTVNIRFREFDALYTAIAQMYPQLPPQLGKLDGADPIELVARKRRSLMQDLLHNLYSLPFVIHLPAFNKLLMIGQYTQVCPSRPFCPTAHYDVYGNRFTYERNAGGETTPQQDEKYRASEYYKTNYQYGINHGYFLPVSNLFFTPVQFNGSLAKITNSFSKWWGSAPDLTKQVNQEQSYGALIVWNYNDDGKTVDIQVIFPLDQKVCDVVAILKQKSHNDKSTHIEIFLGVDNGQVIRLFYDNNGPNPVITGDITVDKTHSTTLCGMYLCKEYPDALITVSRDGTCCFSPNWAGKKLYYNIGETLLSSAFVLDRYLVLGGDSGSLILIDCFARPTSDNARITGSGPNSPAQQPLDRPELNNSHVHEDYYPQRSGCLFTPDMIAYEKPHNGGIRHIAVSQTHVEENYLHTPFSLQYHNNMIPYNIIKHNLHPHEAYHVVQTEKKSIILTNHENDPNMGKAPSLHMSAYSQTYLRLLQSNNKLSPGSQSVLNISHKTLKNLPKPLTTNHHHDYITHLITASHDGTNKVFILNDLINTAEYSASSTIPLVELAEIKAGPSHNAVFCDNTSFFITAHDVDAARLLFWDSNNLQQGPIFATPAFTKQITTMVWIPKIHSVMVTTRDGLVKLFRCDVIFEVYSNQLRYYNLTPPSTLND